MSKGVDWRDFKCFLTQSWMRHEKVIATWSKHEPVVLAVGMVWRNLKARGRGDWTAAVGASIKIRIAWSFCTNMHVNRVQMYILLLTKAFKQMQPTHTHTHTEEDVGDFVAEVATIPKRCTMNSQSAMCVFSSVLFCSKFKAQEQWGCLQVCNGWSFQMSTTTDGHDAK